MASKAPRKLWHEYCEVAPGIRAQFGLASAIGYVVGEKLMTFADMAQTNADYRHELPAFCAGIRELFTKAELLQHFAFVEKETRFDSNLFDADSAHEQRAWVKAMLLQSGS